MQDMSSLRTMIKGQIDLFSYMDEIQEFHHCSGCNNAKFKEHGKNGDLYWCNLTRNVITEHTQDWLCKHQKGSSQYERRIS